MTALQIVRDLTLHDGRWHFAGTLIFIDALVQDHRRQGEAIRPGYRAMGLSDEEIEAAITFPFPAVNGREMMAEAIVLDVRCECGIRRKTVVSPPAYETDACPCGRVWRVGVALSPVVVPGTDPGVPS
jgi:hypothetical protein